MTAYEVRISDWSSDVCSSDRDGPDDRRHDDSQHPARPSGHDQPPRAVLGPDRVDVDRQPDADRAEPAAGGFVGEAAESALPHSVPGHFGILHHRRVFAELQRRSEEHTSELQSLMRISYAVFCLKKNKKSQQYTKINDQIHAQ